MSAFLTPAHRMVLRHIADAPVGKTTARPHRVDIRNVSEAYRQRVIDLGMMDPPLIDIDGDWLHITEAGQLVLEALSTPPRTEGDA